MREAKFFLSALLLLAAATPGRAFVGIEQVNRAFEGRPSTAVVHGELIDHRLLQIDDPVVTLDPVAGDRMVITLRTRQEPGLRQVFSYRIELPPLDRERGLRLVVEGIDVTTGFRTEYYDFDRRPEQPVEVRVDRNRLLSNETFRVHSVFQAVGGRLGDWQLEGNRIRQVLEIGCYFCGIPFPVYDFDLTSEPIGPLPAGDYVLEVVDRLNDPIDGVIHREKIKVLPEPLLLQQGRFEVEVLLDPPHGGRAQLVDLPSADSALFYFFSPDNWELMVKVLDGCHLNDRFWVFGAASTDVGYRIVVNDLLQGTRKEYRHEAGSPAPAITDIAAFPCDASRGESK